MMLSIIVPACFENPLKRYAINFLTEVLALRKRAVIPVTAILGAYHIATKYLRAPRRVVKKILVGVLETRSPALYPQVAPMLVIDALDIATTYNIESWDGYLVALAHSLGAKAIYTLDKGLKRIEEEIAIVNPFPPEKTREYHQYIRTLLSREKR